MKHKIFFSILESFKIQLPEPEYKFHPTRKWRFDYAWPNHKVALEIEGGVWTRGRHTRGSGFIGDMEKYNNAAMLGWRIIRITPNELYKTETINMLNKTLCQTEY